MPKNIFKYIFIVLAVIIIGFTLGYVRTFISLDVPKEKNEIKQNKYVGKIDKTRLSSQANLIFKTYYIKCGHEVTEKKSSNATFSGYTKEQLANKLNHWEIESFTPEQVTLKRKVDDICNEHFYIGIKDGYVSLFQGRPDLPSRVIEQTDIIADVLRKEDRAMLEEGLIIESKEEFLKIREGLTS